VEFQHVSAAQPFHRDLLFAQVAVERGLPADLAGHVLRVFQRGEHRRAIALAHANIIDVYGFGRLLVRKWQHAELLHRGIGLDPQAHREFPSARSIVLEAPPRHALLDHIRLSGVVGRLGVGFLGLLAVGCRQGNTAGQQQEAADLLGNGGHRMSRGVQRRLLDHETSGDRR
jgi:hypothetical protein